MTNNGNWSVMSENTLSEQFPLHRACRDGDVSALSVLLNQLDTARTHLTLEDTYYGWTPTHWAAYFGKLECLKVLLCGTGNGVAATPGLKTSRFQQTPIHIAAFAGHPHCLQWLLQAGADPNAQDYLGETSLHKAARTGATECVDLLALNNAKIGLQNNNSQTAAQLANACSYTALAHHLLLLEGKQDVNGSIARSVPAHGLNGGVFPHSANSALFSNTLMSQASNGCKAPDTNGTAVNGSVNGQANGSAVCTSSNGYYGFQHTNGQTNGHQNAEAIEDCDMETDAAPISNGHNGSTNGQENGPEATIPNAEKNGFSNGQTNGSNNLSLGFTNGHVIGTVLGFTNGQSLTNGPKVNGTSAVNGNSHSTNGTNGFTFKSHNAIGEDITLNKAVSQNHVPIAGCKRSREEGCFPEIKRMRTEGLEFLPVPHSLSKPSPPPTPPHLRLPLSNITNTEKLAERDDHVVSERIKLIENLSTSTNSNVDDGGLWMDVEGSGEEERDRIEDRILRESPSDLSVEMLRETHGCEPYSFFC